MSKHRRRRRRRRGKITDSTPATPGTGGADTSAGTSEADVSESNAGDTHGGGDD